MSKLGLETLVGSGRPSGDGRLLTVTIVVPRKAVGVNQAWRRSKNGGMYMTPSARDYKDAVKAYAIRALRAAKWPPVGQVKAVKVAIEAWNGDKRSDADMPIKLSLDALQGVAFSNDRLVTEVSATKHHDGGEIRTVIRVTLLEGRPRGRLRGP